MCGPEFIKNNAIASPRRIIRIVLVPIPNSRYFFSVNFTKDIKLYIYLHLS